MNVRQMAHDGAVNAYKDDPRLKPRHRHLREVKALPALMERWRRDMRARGLSERTIGDRLEAVTLFGRHAGLEDAPQNGTEDNILDWMADAGAGGWGPGTRHTRHGQLKAWFKWLHRNGHIDSNPMAHVDAPKRPSGKPRPFTPEHLSRIRSVSMRKRTRAMLLLAVCQGLRIHEIAKVRGEDFDLIADTLTVVGKGAKIETMPLHPLVRELAEQMPHSGWWFPSNSTRPGQHITARSVGDILRRVVRRAGVRTGSAHWMRHAFATLLLDMGVDLLVVKELMRHASVATTQRYISVADDRCADAIALFDPFRPRLRHLSAVRDDSDEEIEPEPDGDGDVITPAVIAALREQAHALAACLHGDDDDRRIALELQLLSRGIDRLLAGEDPTTESR